MAYQMKATYLVELAKMQQFMNRVLKTGDENIEMKYFHWFYYEDTNGKVDNQWPGMLKIIVKNV